jgi:urease accessory protein UreE
MNIPEPVVKKTRKLATHKNQGTGATIKQGASDDIIVIEDEPDVAVIKQEIPDVIRIKSETIDID